MKLGYCYSSIMDIVIPLLFQIQKDFRLPKISKRMFLFFVVVHIFSFNHNAESSSATVYSNKWAVYINGDLDTANRVASQLGYVNLGRIFEDGHYYLFSHPRLRKRSLRKNNFHHNNIIFHEKINWAEQQYLKHRVKREVSNNSISFNDRQWDNMWYLHPSFQPSMRVIEAWRAGYTGKNISVTILDDGIERLHSDLRGNYDPFSSWDLNQHDSDPTPRYTRDNFNEHGTRCAGVLAAYANNGICNVGIAYNAKLGGVRMLDGEITDALEAAALSFKSDYVDIYSSSWGPDDNGKTVEGPGTLARKALFDGVKHGRGGKGSIYVWASGNGGRVDNCNCDGYASSIYTLSVSSTTRRRTVPWYTEFCSSTMATTYSSGADGNIITTDLRDTCTSHFTGTSVSAPAAAGICALTLEANPNLTWRDVQHLVVQTAQADGLQANDWILNGANRKVSHAYGFGLMDAYAMVKLAEAWDSVPQQRKYVRPVIYDDHTPRRIPPNSSFLIPVEVVAYGNRSEVFDRLEHVQVVLSLGSRIRGNLVIYLTSPAGTKSTLLGRRNLDVDGRSFESWPFTSVHMWDEDPRGMWMLEIQHDEGENIAAQLSLFTLILYGTKQSDWPPHLRISHPTSTSNSVTVLTRPTTTKSQLASSTRETASSKTTQSPEAAAAYIKDVNCKMSSSRYPGCLICETSFFLDIVNNSCRASCGAGFFHTTEKVNITGREIPDRVNGMERLICSPCPQFCQSCSRVSSCIQCVKGAQFHPSNSSCIPESSLFMVDSDDSVKSFVFTNLYIILGVAAVIFACVLIYAIISYKKRMAKVKLVNSPKVTYHPVRDGLSSVSTYSDSESFDDIALSNPLLSTSVSRYVETNETKL